LIENQKLKFVLTGSSARKLKKSGVNLLAGRASRLNMYPFTPKELGEDFSFDEVLQYGSLPLIWSSESRAESLEAYVQMYLKEEIKAEALVRNLSGFVRFLPVLALYNGQVLNISSTARDAGVSRTTVNGFIEILEDTLLVNKLSPYQAGLSVRERKHPKLYWVDCGLVRASKKQKGPLSIEEKGSLFEGYIFNCLKMKMEYESSFDEMSYWSPTGAKNIEVDFLLKSGQEFTAIEVKMSQRLRPEDLKGLKAIKDLKGLKRRVLVYQGEKRVERDGIEVLPFSLFQKEFLTV
jgi:predicted AAA+ superfamily ATPase